jgi:two-component system, chemotaxis family, chemotaxis protein CheY
MPGMSGIDLVREVRNMSDYKFTPILVLTTESQQDIKQKGRAAGATGWIVKPFNPEVLLSVLGKVLA